MTRLQLRRLFRRHRGESARLARELGLSGVTITRWFQGHVESARIEVAVFSRAKELLKKEAQKREDQEQIRRDFSAAQGSAA
jgi:hypothetical protein